MIRKRVGWLCVLFLGEMLTASAMGFFEKEIARAVVLALFVPLIISSGGNSGSQATTLVIRAMALGEVKLRDWWRVIRREFVAGLVLGAVLALIGFYAHRRLGGAVPHLRRALRRRRDHGRAQPDRRRAVGDAGRLDAAVRAAAARLRPRERVRAVRRHAGRRQRPRHLLHGGRHDPAGDVALIGPRPRRTRRRCPVAVGLAPAARGLRGTARGRARSHPGPRPPTSWPTPAARRCRRSPAFVGRGTGPCSRIWSPPTARRARTSTTSSSCSAYAQQDHDPLALEAVREVLDDLVCLSLPVARIWGFNDSKDTSSIRRSPQEGFREDGLRGPRPGDVGGQAARHPARGPARQQLGRVRRPAGLRRLGIDGVRRPLRARRLLLRRRSSSSGGRTTRSC